MKKGVIIVNKNLPNGLKANIAAVLAMSLGQTHPHLLGESVSDADGVLHTGITTIPLPILEAEEVEIRFIQTDAVDLFVSFNDVALVTKNYSDYTQKLLSTQNASLVFHGVLLYGDKSVVNKAASQFALLK